MKEAIGGKQWKRALEEGLIDVKERSRNCQLQIFFFVHASPTIDWRWWRCVDLLCYFRRTVTPLSILLCCVKFIQIKITVGHQRPASEAARETEQKVFPLASRRTRGSQRRKNTFNFHSGRAQCWAHAVLSAATPISPHLCHSSV